MSEQGKKTFRQVCTCEKCGNEAEMVVTCSWEEVEKKPTGEKKAKGHATCSKCGNEADIWVDLPES